MVTETYRYSMPWEAEQSTWERSYASLSWTETSRESPGSSMVTP
jgi:hypothetical protein